MRVLHLIDAMGLGGAQTIIKEIFEKQQDNTDIYAYALRKKGITLEIDHPNIILNESEAKYSFAPLQKIRELIKQYDIDILHCHLFRSEIFGYMIKRSFPNVKLIYHEHGQIVRSDTGRVVEDWGYNRFNKHTQAKVDLFIAVSNAMREHLIENANISDDKIKTLINFVDLDKFNQDRLPTDVSAFKEEIGVKEGNFVVGFAGRLIKRKGWREYIKAAKILTDKYDNIQFLLAGDGADRDAVATLIKENSLEGKVMQLGYVSDMLQFYATIDCFVMPSHFEGLPMAQLEVMALGLPLVSTDGPGMDEVPTDGVDAIYAKMYNPPDVAAKIEQLYQDEDLRKTLGANALVNVRDYSLDNYVEKLNATYAELMGVASVG